MVTFNFLRPFVVSFSCTLKVEIKDEVFTVHVMETEGQKRYSTSHSQPQHKMEVSRFHTATALPPGQEPSTY